MKHRLLYNQRSRPLVVRRENAGFKTLSLPSEEPKVAAWFLHFVVNLFKPDPPGFKSN